MFTLNIDIDRFISKLHITLCCWLFRSDNSQIEIPSHFNIFDFCNLNIKQITDALICMMLDTCRVVTSIELGERISRYMCIYL